MFTDFNSVSISGNILKSKEDAHFGIYFYNEDDEGNEFGKSVAARLTIKEACELCAMLLHSISEFEKDDANTYASYKSAIKALDNFRKIKLKDLNF